MEPPSSNHKTQVSMEEALDVITTKVESTENIPLLVREIQPLWTNAAHVPRITYRIYIYIYRYTRLCIGC